MDSSLWWLTAKSSVGNDNLWLPLVFHLRDTAEVMMYLLRHWVADAFYSEIGLSRRETKRIALFLAFSHDVGKSIPLFQSKITWHLPEIREALFEQNLPLREKYQNKDNAQHAHAGAVLLRSMGVSESVAVIVGAHHGKPESMGLELLDSDAEIRINQTVYGWNCGFWPVAQRKIVQSAMEQAGYQWEEKGDLPKLSEEAQMLLTGLLITADWIASNTKYFPLISIDAFPQEYDEQRAERALKELSLPEPYIVADHWKNSDFFRERFGFEPNQIQKECICKAQFMENPGLLILEAPMGTGKTEAALAVAEILMNRFNLGGLAFFLPSQATSNAMLERILQWIENQPDADHIALELSHSNAKLNKTFREICEGSIQVQEDENDFIQKTIVHQFFDGRKTQLLANVVIGTVDQLLMAALKQRHVMLRQLGLMGKVVIVDECHAYDAYMNIYLDRILKWLSAYGIPVILLSATLPGKRRTELLEAYAGRIRKQEALEHLRDYPLLSMAEARMQKQKVCTEPYVYPIPYKTKYYDVLIIKASEDAAYDEIKTALEKGGCVGIIFNTVRRAQNAAEILQQKFPEAKLYIDHSCFLLPDRMEHEEEIMKRVGKKSVPEDRKKIIVLGTQVLEQSLDLDFDLLVTDLCPMDLLLQRIGREHRHNRVRPKELEQARCIILHSDPDALEEGAKKIYGEYLLRRTIQCLPDQISIPQDIPVLIQLVYDENIGKEFLQAEYEEYNNIRKTQENKAESYCLDEPYDDEIIAGLLDDDPFYGSDIKARAAVRDGEDTIEVIAIQKDVDGHAILLSGKEKGRKIDMTRAPSGQEIELLEEQRIRLPLRLTRVYGGEQIENILIEQMKQNIPEWMMQPVLMNELIMIFNPDGEMSLDQKTKLRYDSRLGLQC